ncbi:AEC family transporter [Anaerotignum sp.]
MEEILVKAGGFLFMIALGFVLKRIGLFSIDDSSVLSKIVLKVTLPMSIISNFRGLELSSSFLIAILIGFAVHFIAIPVALFVTRKKPAEQKAFYIINTSGYNIGLCTLPYMSSFFAAEAVAVVCMFDVGNAIMCFGITFAIATMVSKGKGNVNKREIVKTLLSSMPFVTYLVMIILCALQLSLPEPVYTVAGMIGQANAFVAMLLIGILFEPKFNRSELKDMLGVFSLRMILGTVFALIIYHMLPLPLMYRQILAVIVFSPILSVAPIYTERCGYNRSVAAVLNSLMLPFSMVVMTILLMLLKVY